MLSLIISETMAYQLRSGKASVVTSTLSHKLSRKRHTPVEEDSKSHNSKSAQPKSAKTRYDIM